MKFSDVILVVVVVVTMEVRAENRTQMQECRKTIFKMTDCFYFVTGKTTSPTMNCCKAVNTTAQQQRNKPCLCKFIALVHQGYPESTEYHIQEAKLTRLPSACNLHNIDASTCPKFGHINITNAHVAAGHNPKLPLHFEVVAVIVMMAFLYMQK